MSKLNCYYSKKECATLTNDEREKLYKPYVKEQEEILDLLSSINHNLNEIVSLLIFWKDEKNDKDEK